MNKKAKLISYIVAGYPDLEQSHKIAIELIKTGTDILEIGIPFSDPVADGKIIQYSTNEALKNNINLDDCLRLTTKIKKDYPHIKIILMGYFNPIFKYGIKTFNKAAIKANVDSLIIVDLPYEEQINYLEYLDAKLPLINLVTPLTSEKRLKQINKANNEFIYYISVFGITGTQEPDFAIAKNQINKIKKITNKKIALGFGIKKAHQVKEAANIADYVVIGSAYLEIIKKDENNIQKILTNIAKYNTDINKALK